MADVVETGFRKKEGLTFRPNKSGLWWPIIMAASGGIMQTLSWPWPGLWPLTFVALVPLILAVDGQTGGRAFALGWVYGLALSLSSLPWLASVLVGYGGLGYGLGWLVMGLLAAILAIYPALFGWIITLRIESPLVWALTGSVAWCGLDWLKNWVFTGFNWTPLAGPLILSPQMGQSADLVGFYGLGFFVALINFLLAAAIFKRLDGGFKKSLPYVALAGIVFTALYGYGHIQFNRWNSASRSFPKATVVAVQPVTEQTYKWDEAYRERLLAKFTSLANSAATANPWLVIWPETALPFIFDHDHEETEWLKNLNRENGGYSLFGVAGISGFWPDQKLHNRLILFHDGEPEAHYDKAHLVPFGEYVPLEWLPFLKWTFMQGLIGAAGTYSPGQPAPPLDVPLELAGREGGAVRLGPLICFESIFPYLGRRRVLDGAELLVVPTNDGWFGRSRAPEQHLYQAAMRAVETRRPVARVGNTGISAVIYPSGVISWSSQLYDLGAYPMAVPLPGPSKLTTTFFVQKGYLWAPLMAILTGLLMVIRFFRKP